MSHPPLRLRITPPIGEPFEHLCESDTLVVGRSSKADLVLSDRFLSRLHARFFVEGGETWYVEDLGSRNTTLLNGRPVASPMHLAAGDLVKLSETVITVEGFDAAAERPRSEPADISSSDSILLRSASELMAAAERESGDRMKLLNEVHRALATSISLEELLELVLDRAFAHLRPEEGIILLKGSLGELEQAATRRLPGATGDFFVSRSLAREVAEKGQAALVLDAQTDARFAAAESILSSGVRTLVAAPLLAPDANLGMIVLSSRVHVRRYSEEDMELLAALASVAALRIRNISLAEEAARRRALERELNIARQIQIALLPENLPEVPGYSLFATNDASRSVSGDFYEVQTSEGTGGLVMVIADVSGKGMSASLVAASLDALLMGPIEVGHPPDAICARVGRRLNARTPPERYATAIVASLDPKTGVLSYTNAGHNAGLLIRADGSAERLEGTGLPLGLFPIAEYERKDVTLAPGDLVVLYTDGITEAADEAGEEFGLDRLEKVVKEQAREPLVALAVAIETAVEVFAEERRFADDRTLVILRREPDESSS
ncbi:MAG: SpoIIE family protein phosphatase [Acidobacteria bacterium]|jgi:serine phosphatase RsbU (regulator of sigma subunit)/pSer/pThr/pTyr-binding forkhead associated (FHA) protein|nr:SpoIIE family protein phosphatase [Acidobacteriota bacterium]